MIGSKLRRMVFLSIDALKGGAINDHLRSIESLMKSKEPNNMQLNLLLSHANTTVPYYKRLEELDFKDLPILNKNDFKENYDDFKSEIFLSKKIHRMSTSGSTGTPFTVYQDMNKRKRTIAELIYFNEVVGQKLGDRYMYIKAFPNNSSRIENIKQNVIPIDILKLNNKLLGEIRAILKEDKKINSILAYASSYEQLADYLDYVGDNSGMFNLKVVFSSSALITDDTKTKLSEIFGCPIIDRYSNQENGVLAQTQSTFGEFKVNKASYRIELLKLNSNEIAGKGELGRIVITDLYNFAMPMIRYDTGNLAISDDEDRGNLSTLRNIQGRRVDIIYDTSGDMLTPHTWGVHMRKYDELKQWQFIQEDAKEYVLKINGGEGIYSKEDFDTTLRTILGKDANIEIQFVDQIPVLSSGKFKNTICNYKLEN